jgi:hypothetical protein
MFVDDGWKSPDEAHFSHLLGLYLGDGHLAQYPRTYRLVITCDALYPALVDACRPVALLDSFVPTKS